MRDRSRGMSRVLRPGDVDDRSFDREFWREQGIEQILFASWDMVNEVRVMRGEHGSEPRLQRSVCRVVRPAG
jgi:hypothetical protein